MTEWEVFQRDVLDVLRQYEGFFDFFERVGSLSDDSRPDCFGRITREDKKEIWVVDAKNKPEIDSEDRERMKKYVEMLKSNPIDAGLELGELSDYSFRRIFVTANGEPALEDYESVKFKSFHQFLQKELVYTDTDRVVRDVSKMVERKQLSQSQARLLFRSLKPFENRVKQAEQSLEDIETDFVGLKLKKPPLKSFERSIPVDVVLQHEERDKTFLFDVPYSRKEVKKVDDKVDEVKERLNDMDKEVYYAAINTFEQYDSEYVLQPEEVEKEVKQTAGIVSPDEIADLFTPKLRTEKRYEDETVKVTDRHGFDFQLVVKSVDDVTHSIEAVVPEEAVSRMKNTLANSRREFGELKDNRFRMDITIDKGLEVKYGDTSESFEAFKDSVKSIFQSSVSPVLGKKVKTVER